MSKKTKVLLASGQPSVTTSYVGEGAAPYLQAMILGSPTLSNDRIQVYEEVAKAIPMQIVTTANLIQAAGCDFNHQGTVTLTEKLLAPTDLKVNVELCKNPLRGTWRAKTMGASRMGLDMPDEFGEFIATHISAKTGADLERNIWNGNSANAGAPTLFNGFVKLLTDDGGADGTTGNTDAWSTTNVITRLRAAIALLPEALDGATESVKIYAPRQAVSAYVQKLGDQGWMDRYSDGEKPLNIDGYEIYPTPGMDWHDVVVTYPENLAFGTDLLSDSSEVRVIDMEDNDGSDNVRYVSKFTAGVQIGIRSDIVLYKVAA